MRLARLTILSLLAMLTSAAQDALRFDAFSRRIERLERAVDAAESVRAVKRLQNAYGHYAEVGLWNDLANLFSENAVGYYPAGRLEGKPRLRKLFFEEIGLNKMGLDDGRIYPHIVFQPVVTVAPDGKTAAGRWRLISMLGRFRGNATWASGVYENDFIRENGVWKISQLRCTGKAGGPYAADGWKEQNSAIPFPFTSVVDLPPLDDPQGPPTIPITTSRVTDLFQRVDRLEAETEATNLQNTYGYYTDRKLWDQVADLFTADGTMELGQEGVYVGKASIRRGLNRFGPQGLRQSEVNDHVHLQMTVTVAPDALSARIRGVDFAVNRTNAQNAQWTEGIFENELVKQDGRWKIRSVQFYPRFTFDNEKGWAADAKPAPRPSKEFPPDKPPTEVYEIYPKFSMIPFHFVHPVTGRPPDYPGGRAFLQQSRTSPRSPAEIRTTRELETKLAEAEKILEKARAYDAAENLINAYGFYADEHLSNDAASLFVPSDRIRQALATRFGEKQEGSFTIHQIAQPVIQPSADGRSAKIRARTLEFRQTGAKATWVSGIYEGETIYDRDTWKLKSLDTEYTWTAGYRREDWHRYDGVSPLR